MKLSYILAAVGCFVLLSLKFPLGTQADNSVVFEDDFSQGLVKWQPVRDDGEWWQIIEGQAAITIPYPSTISELVPKDQYWDQNWKNLEYQLDFTSLDGTDKNISFGFQNTCNWYEFHFVDSFVNLARLQNCFVPFSVNRPVQIKPGETYQIKIRFLNGLISLYVNQLLIVQERDWSFDHRYGKIGLKAGTGASYPTTLRYDNIKVTLIDQSTERIGVENFKQTDPVWKNVEYDSAQKWSTKPTFGRWGCAVTSLAMIMRYYGLSVLPDDRPLTPETLNSWLKSQKDGYLGEGQLNWAAAMRLTAQLSQKLGTPKLEYQARSGSNHETARTEIKKFQPVVLQIDGHFLVGEGIALTDQDLLIQDPAYSYQKFAQHQLPLLSTRTFEPSFTDLSYFVFAYQPGLVVNITNETGQKVSGEILTESLVAFDAETEESTGVLEQLLVSKPKTGSYTISVTQPAESAYTLEFWAYDVNGEAIELTQTGQVGVIPLNYTLDFNKELGTAQLSLNPSWTGFRQQLYLAAEQKNFTYYALFWYLDDLALRAELADQSAAEITLKLAYIQRFVNALNQALSFHQTKIELTTFEELQDYLISLDP